MLKTKRFLFKLGILVLWNPLQSCRLTSAPTKQGGTSSSDTVPPIFPKEHVIFLKMGLACPRTFLLHDKTFLHPNRKKNPTGVLWHKNTDTHLAGGESSPCCSMECVHHADSSVRPAVLTAYWLLHRCHPSFSFKLVHRIIILVSWLLIMKSFPLFVLYPSHLNFIIQNWWLYQRIGPMFSWFQNFSTS